MDSREERDAAALRVSAIMVMGSHDKYITLIPDELKFLVYEENIPAFTVYSSMDFFRNEYLRR